jgi:hypothetical protein
MSIHPMFALMANIPQPVRTCRPGDFQLNASSDGPLLPNEYPELMGGLYSDNILTPAQIRQAFYQQAPTQIQPSQLSEALLEPTNMEYIRQQIENNLRQYTGEDNIRFLLTKEFAQTCIDQIMNNPGLGWDAKVGLPLLNDIIIHHESEIAKLSARHNKRFTRWVLEGDRVHGGYLPYGFGDKTLHARGENQVSPSGYGLNHPDKSQYLMYLRDVLHIQCPSLSTAPCKMGPPPKPFYRYPNP